MLLKNITKLVFVLAVILAPCVAESLTVSISDGTTTKSSSFGKFVLSIGVSSTIPSTTTLFLLQNCTAPCSVGFPSGSSPAASNDTLVFADLSSGSRASVVVNKQSSTATMTLTNLRVTSRVSGKTLTMIYKTASGELGAVTTNGSYPINIALSGTYRTSIGAQASACSSGVSSPCVQSKLQVNGATISGVGSTSSTFVTATVPCSGFASTSPPPSVPCSPTSSPAGSYTSSTGNFSGVSDKGSISCLTPCNATQTGTVMAKFNGANETLTLSGSNAAATSLISVENPNSWTGVFTALHDELGANFFVAYTSANGEYQVIPNPPLTNETRNINNSSNQVLSFLLERALLQESSNVPLVSIGCDNLSSDTPGSCLPPGSPPLAPSATSPNDAAYITFIPSTLAFKDLNILQLFYQQIANTMAFSGDPRLGDVFFSDCSSGSLRVDITLEDPKTHTVGTVRVYLGSNEADNFRSDCEGAEATLGNGSNLPDNRDARVDTADIGGSCCETFKSAQSGTAGKFIVKAITWVVDQGIPKTFLNYKVNTQNMVVNGFNALGSLVSLGPPQQVGSSNLPQDGTFMRITKLSTVNGPCSGLAGTPCPTIVDVIPSSAISTSGNKFSSSVNVNDLFPVAGGTTYAVEMCLFGGTSLDGPASASEEDLLNYFKSFQGTCPATVGIMTLK